MPKHPCIFDFSGRNPPCGSLYQYHTHKRGRCSVKRTLCLLLAILLMLPALALAGESLYINNPNPSDRLHLREEPDGKARSMGKFYNGAPITIEAYSSSDWVKVTVDKGAGGLPLTGWMNRRYLSATKPQNAMPQYVTLQKITSLIAIGKGSSIPAGTPVSLMGVNERDHQWYLKAYLTDGSTVSFVVAENHAALSPLNGGKSLNVYISNPNPADRLHLRATPGKSGRDMGKYYNGCVATLKGFSEDGKWLKVSLYGRTGWMNRQYLYIEGQGSNPTHYAIPEVRTLSGATLYQGENGTGKTKALSQNTMLEVLGLIGNDWLHVRMGDTIGYIRQNQTTFAK